MKTLLKAKLILRDYPHTILIKRSIFPNLIILHFFYKKPVFKQLALEGQNAK